MTNTACTLFDVDIPSFLLLKYPTLRKQEIACQTLSEVVVRTSAPGPEQRAEGTEQSSKSLSPRSRVSSHAHCPLPWGR